MYLCLYHYIFYKREISFTTNRRSKYIYFLSSIIPLNISISLSNIYDCHIIHTHTHKKKVKTPNCLYITYVFGIVVQSIF